MKLESSEQFDRMLRALIDDVIMASNHYELHKNLSKDVTNYERVLNETPAFWSLTLRAHLETSLFRLCRIYDQNGGALHLNSFVCIIQKNLGLFEVEKFKERLKDNPYVESLAQTARAPDAHQLAADVELTSNKNSTVRKLTILRNNVYAHKNADGVKEDKKWLSEYPLTYGEIDELIVRARDVLNRYSSLFKAHTYSLKMIGSDDYKYLLDLVRGGSEAHRAQIQQEIDRASGRKP